MSQNKTKSICNLTNEFLGKNNKEECQVKGNPGQIAKEYNKYLSVTSTLLKYFKES